MRDDFTTPRHPVATDEMLAHWKREAAMALAADQLINKYTNGVIHLGELIARLSWKPPRHASRLSLQPGNGLGA